MAEIGINDQLKVFESMTNAELRDELERRGSTTSGNKKDLLAKLRHALLIENKLGTQNEAFVVSVNESIIHNDNQNLNRSDDLNDHQRNSSSSHLTQVYLSSSNETLLTTNKSNPTSTIENRSSTYQTAILTDWTFDKNIDESGKELCIKNDQNTEKTEQTQELMSLVSKINEEQLKDGKDVRETSSSSSTDNNHRTKSESSLKESHLLSEEVALSIPKLQQDTLCDINDFKKDADRSNENLSNPKLLSSNRKPNITVKRCSTSINTAVGQAPSSTEKKKCQSNSGQLLSPLIKGFHRSSDRLNLSSHLLQSLIPNLSLTPESVVNEELDQYANNQRLTKNVESSFSEIAMNNHHHNESKSSESMTIGDLVDQKQYQSRLVVLDVNNKPLNVRVNNKIGDGTKSNCDPKSVGSGKTNAAITDELVRVKAPSSVKERISRVLHIRGLARPFTSTQLKEVLRRYGSIRNEDCWLDKIKSQCLVIYRTIEEAREARDAIDGCCWPSTNQTALSVRFTQEEKFNFCKMHDLPPDEKAKHSTDHSKYDVLSQTLSCSLSESSSETETIKARHAQEADASNFEEKASSGFLINEEESMVDDNASEKSLDDYFRKTNAKPVIYWLPLTDEQMSERRNQKMQQRHIECEERKRKRARDDTLSKKNSHHCSSTSRDKRKCA